MSRALAALGLLAGLVSQPALAAPSAYDTAFVAEFEKACVPGRLRYEDSRKAAEAAGWVATSAQSHPELQALMARSETEALAPDLVGATFTYQAYAKEFAGVTHHLVVSRSGAVIDDQDDPLVFVGCYLYNFEATAPVDPEPVTTLIGNPNSDTHEMDGAISHIWGPPCPMPRTFDTYLNFVAAGSQATEIVPFTGVALNFSTSELPPGEPVPDPYC